MPDYGSLEESAKKLLKHAEERVRRGHDFDTLHLIHAALDHPTSETPGCQLLASLIDKDKQALMNVLEFQLGLLHGEAISSINKITDGLGKCIKAWKDAAQRSKVGITDALILQIIITRDTPTIDMMTEYGMPIAEIKRKLDAQIADKHQTPEDEDEEARKEARHLLKPLTPDNHIRRDMHRVILNSFLGGLAQCIESQDGKIAILTGQDGSPAEKLPQILALLLLNKEVFIDQFAFLNDYTGIEMLSLEAVHALAHAPGKPEPSRVLEMAKQETIKNNTLLMLEYIETLARHHTTTTEGLKEVMLDRGEALIFGLHISGQEEGQGTLPNLGLANIIPIEIRAYSPERTKTFLQSFYYQAWEEQGFHFTEDAFDLLCHLAPGAWVHQKHMVLPYLAVDIGHATIQMAHGGEQVIQETAQDACEELKRLRTEEWAKTPDHKRKPFEEALGHAETEIEKLANGSSPALPKSEQKLLLTRAHVLAQFLCPDSGSEFHYPGQAPDLLKNQQRSHRKASH